MSGKWLNLVYDSFASWKPSPKQSYEVSTAHLPLSRGRGAKSNCVNSRALWGEGKA